MHSVFVLILVNTSCFDQVSIKVFLPVRLPRLLARLFLQRVIRKAVDPLEKLS